MGVPKTGEWRGSHRQLPRGVDDIATSFFVTNFPPAIGVKDLWGIGEKYGKVCDVFIAPRLSKMGKRFDFIKFLKVFDANLLVDSLRTEWIGSFHLFASVARFGRMDRNQHTRDRKVQVPPTSNANDQSTMNRPIGNTNPSLSGSYVRVLQEGGSKARHAPIVQPPAVVTLQGNEVNNALSLVPSIFAKVRYVKSIPNMLVLLREKGFDDITVSYVGGEWIYIVFDSDELCTKFKNSKGVRSLFSTLRPVVNGFRVPERVIWVEVMGLPCCAWNESAIKKVVAAWGEVCFMEDCEGIPLATKRVCLKTKSPNFIQEKIKVMAQGIAYDVMIRELFNWEPEFVDQGVSDIPPSSDFDSEQDEQHLGSEGDEFDPEDQQKENDIEDGEIHFDDSEKTFTDNQNRGAGFVDRNGRYFPTNGRNMAKVQHEDGAAGEAAVAGSRVVKTTGVAPVSVQQHENAATEQPAAAAGPEEGATDSARAAAEPAKVRTSGSWSHESVRILKKTGAYENNRDGGYSETVFGNGGAVGVRHGE